MLPDLIGNAFDARIAAEIDRHAARLLEPRFVELQPFGHASAREPAVRHCDIRVGASAGDVGPAYAVGRAGGEEAPCSAAPLDLGHAAVVGAISERLLREEVGIAVI